CFFFQAEDGLRDWSVTGVQTCALPIYHLPIGSGHWLNPRHLERVFSGWSVSSIISEQSGSPFSILSTRGTLNRAGQSGGNTVNRSEERRVGKDGGSLGVAARLQEGT